MRAPIDIIPEVTKCVDGIVCEETGSNYNYEVCGDSIVDGDRIMCPKHCQVVLLRFTYGWWEAYGGSSKAPASFWGYCGACHHIYGFIAWSYRG